MPDRAGAVREYLPHRIPVHRDTLEKPEITPYPVLAGQCLDGRELWLRRLLER